MTEDEQKLKQVSAHPQIPLWKDFFFLQSGRASQWWVCYQRGLTCLFSHILHINVVRTGKHFEILVLLETCPLDLRTAIHRNVGTADRDRTGGLAYLVSHCVSCVMFL